MKDVVDTLPELFGEDRDWAGLHEASEVRLELDVHTANILRSVWEERQRQEELKARGKFAYTCADSEMSNPERLSVLGEEFGEVCHEVNEAIGPGRMLNREQLRKELIQVAAVCVAWVEALDR